MAALSEGNPTKTMRATCRGLMAALPPPNPSPDTFPSVPKSPPRQKLLRILGNNDGDIRPPSVGSGAAPAAFAIAPDCRGGKAKSGCPQGLEVARGSPE